MTPTCMAPPMGLRGFSPWLRGQHFQSERQLVAGPGPCRGERYERCVAVQRHPIRGSRPACLADLEKCFDAGLSVVVLRVFRRASCSPTISMSYLASSEYHGGNGISSWPGSMERLATIRPNRAEAWGAERPLAFSPCSSVVEPSPCKRQTSVRFRTGAPILGGLVLMGARAACTRKVGVRFPGSPPCGGGVKRNSLMAHNHPILGSTPRPATNSQEKGSR